MRYTKLGTRKKKDIARTRSYRTTTDTMNMVYQKLYHETEGKSQLDIAHLIGRKGKYPALRAILLRMVEIGWLERTESTSPTNGHLVYLYKAIKYDLEGNRVS